MKRAVFMIPENVHTLELLRICERLCSVGYRSSDLADLIGVIVRFSYIDFDADVYEAMMWIMSDLCPSVCPF